MKVTQNPQTIINNHSR